MFDERRKKQRARDGENFRHVGQRLKDEVLVLVVGGQFSFPDVKWLNHQLNVNLELLKRSLI